MANRVDALERGRESYARRAWLDACEALTRADRSTPLAAEDLELLATSAYMVGRDDDHLRCLERACGAHLAAGAPLRAARCAFWHGIELARRGELGPATGWLGRAQRLVDREGRDCVERGYLMIPVLLRHVGAGEWEAASSVAADAAEIGERFGDADLPALARHEQGHALVRLGRVEEGLGLLDEAMVAAVAGELSPIATGLVYCSVIAYCQELYELRRAQEWTAALTRWCEEQPQMTSFTGQCLVHRAEIMQLRGGWGDALQEARRAAARLGTGMSQVATAQARYREAEVHRLRGDLREAEEAYRDASRLGWEPQPGLALLRLAQGRRSVAVAAIGRVARETSEPLSRAGLLPAYVEIMVAAGEVELAGEACRELEEIAATHESAMLAALVATASGTVLLAEGDAAAALATSRRAGRMWQELEVPYEAARARVLVALACRALGDDDAADLELAAARGVFEALEAAPDLARLDALAQARAGGDHHGLTAREVEVLRLAAAGRSNREIASALVISEHTVARHMQNIFAKLGVSSRTAAGAFAFRQGLL